MKKTILCIACLLMTMAVMCQAPASKVEPPKKDTIPMVTITLPLDRWLPVTDIIMKSNVPAQQFLQVNNDIVRPVDAAYTKYLAAIKQTPATEPKK